jgi:hypothetical protein
LLPGTNRSPGSDIFLKAETVRLGFDIQLQFVRMPLDDSGALLIAETT